ncbi:MAG: hypothetical protein KatS3mg035_0954 [Bacteroidia bacterium]|nr:MAG: hypothetical protein KatS3mg035_0954 [Bacteroidia bacterium]
MKKQGYIRQFVVFCIVYFLSWQFLDAQKNDDEPKVLIHSVTSLKSINEQIQMCSDLKGGFYAVWKSSRGENGVFSLYGQKVNKEGKLLWATDGLLLTQSKLPQNHPQILTDEEGNLIVVWEEGESPNIDIYAQKFDTLGKNLWRQPLNLTPKEGDQIKPQLLKNHKNQFFVFWEEEQKGFSGKDIYAQSFNENGRLLWDLEGIPIVKEKNIQQNFQVVFDPGYDLIVLWEDFRSGKVWELYAQKINFQGEKLWDSSGVNILNNLWFNQKKFSVVGDGYGGFVCAFEASGLSTAQNDIHIVRVNTIGIKVFDHVVSNVYESQVNPFMVKKAGTAYLFWEDYRLGNADLYAQKVNLYTGDKEWDSLGVPICTQKAHQTQLQCILLDNTQNLMIFWLDERYSKSVYAQSISYEGKYGFRPDGVLLTDTQNPVREYQTLFNSDNTIWIAYISESVEGVLPKFQKIKYDGTLLFDIQGQPLHAYQSSITARLDELKMVKGLNNDIYFAWKDYRNGDLNPDIYLMRTDIHGNPLWQEGGIPICTEEGEQGRPLIVPTSYGALVAWVDRRLKNDENLYIQAIDTNGYIYHPANGLPLCLAPRSQNDLKIIQADNNYLCQWTDARNLLTTGFDIYYQLLDSLGFPLLSKNGVGFQNTPAYENTPQLLQWQNSIYSIWMDDRSMYYNIYCQRLTNKGNPLWRTGGIPIQKGPYHQRHHLLEILQDESAVVIWSDERLGSSYEKLFMQKLSPQGQFMWKLGGLEVCTAISRQVAPKIITDPDNGFIVTWLDSRNTLSSNYNLYSIRLSSHAGIPLWDPKGLKIGEDLLEDYLYEMGMVGKKVFYVWHQRASSGYEQVFWQVVDLYSGKLKNPVPQAIGSIKRHQTHPNFVVSSDNQVLVAWLEKNIYIIEDKIMLKPIVLP